MNAVAKQGLRFTRAYPEGMPTIPARRAIMAGRRTYPFRGWRPYRELPPQPGWEPVGSDGKMWAEVLRENGWTTGYVTDNPHLLLGRAQALPPPLRPRGAGGRAGAAAAQAQAQGLAGAGEPPSAARAAQLARRAAHGGLPRRQPAQPPRGGLPLRQGLPRGHGLDRVGAHAPALRAGDRLVRRPRALGRPAPHQGPLRRTQRAARADPALSHPVGQVPLARARRRPARPDAPALRGRDHARGHLARATSWTGWPTSAWPRTPCSWC